MFTRESSHDRALGSIRGPSGPGRAAGRHRRGVRRGRLRVRGLRPPLAGWLRRQELRVRARAAGRAGHLRQPEHRRRRDLHEQGPRRVRPGVPGGRRAGRRRPRAGDHDERHPLLRRAGRRRAGQQGRPLRPGADLAGGGEPGRLPVQLRRPLAHAGGARVHRAADRPRGRVRRLQRRQRDHQRGPRPRRVDLDAGRRAPRPADLRQPRRRLDAGPGRPARDGRRPGPGPGDHARSPRSRSSRST